MSYSAAVRILQKYSAYLAVLQHRIENLFPERVDCSHVLLRIHAEVLCASSRGRAQGCRHAQNAVDTRKPRARCPSGLRTVAIALRVVSKPGCVW